MNWAEDEFENLDLGDKRLNQRLVKLCDSFSQAPESPINQACQDWHETKSAYRFFQNENVDVGQIMTAHRDKTALRAATHKTILAIQDTSYFIYTNHPKTKGLGEISMKEGKHRETIYSRGLVMHTCFAITTQGTPLGLFDQKIFARESRPDHERRCKGGNQDRIAVEQKESYRWIETLETTSKIAGETRIVTVCDRECDFYDFFKAASKNGSTVLVRAAQNRIINRKSRYSEKKIEKLWGLLASKKVIGSYDVEVSAVAKSKHCKGRTARTAHMEIKLADFKMNPPRNHPKHKIEALGDLHLYAVHALEKNPPEGEEPVEWMLITNQHVKNLAAAIEQMRWYALRWRIEMFFKVLKSGFRVEACRLGTADRLIRYLMLMSIIAWRLFMITLMARANPSRPCSEFLSKPEWTVLTIKASRARTVAPSIADAIVLIAKLGGYLARKSDGPPGTLALWRGFKRLTDLTEGWSMANQL